MRVSTDEHSARDERHHQVIADEYDAIVVEPRAVANALLFKRLASSIDAGDRMLDLGCGTGHMTLRFGGAFKEVVAVDHSEAMLARARRTAAQWRMANVTFVHADVRAYLQGEGADRFDLIACTGLLHHLPPAEIPGTVRGASRLLRRGGALLVAEPIDADRACPSAVRAWNRASAVTLRRYSIAVPEPEEAPIARGLLETTLVDAGLTIERAHRSWELFPRRTPPTIVDWIAIWTLDRVFGRTGNVLSVVARKN
jgi:ubiquinone/menaquinone biosynthesis C-methylase UbiE